MHSHLTLLWGILAGTAIGCSTIPVRSLEPMQQNNLLVLLENGHFDGERLTGRLLLGVREGRGTIDPASWPFGGLYVLSVKRCGSQKELQRYVADGGRLASHDGTATSISLVPGDWYGRNVDVPITEAENEPQVDCVLVEALVTLNATGKPGSQIRFSIRAERGDTVALTQPTGQ